MNIRLQIVHASKLPIADYWVLLPIPKPTQMYSLYSLPATALTVWNEPLMITYSAQPTLQAGLFVLGIFFILGALMLRIRSFYRNRWATVNGPFVPDMDTRMTLDNFYIAGHPENNAAVSSCTIGSSEDSILFELSNEEGNPVTVERINFDSILKIKVQDAFTVKNISAPRIWEDAVEYLERAGYRKGFEIAFLVIEWRRDDSKHSVFLFIPGDSAMQKAVNRCNELNDLRRSYQLLQSGLSLQTT